MKTKFCWIVVLGVVIATRGGAEATFTALPAGFSISDVSNDGRVAIGLLDGRPARWSASDGFLEYGEGVTFHDLSGNGKVIVGSLYGRFRPDDFDEPFWVPTLWRDDSPRPEHLIPSRTGGWATAVSDDGTVIIGDGYDIRVSGLKPTRWDLTTGNSEPTWSDYHVRSLTLSADGATMVGSWYIENPFRFETFRWTEESGFVPIAEGLMNYLKVSGNGQIVFAERGSEVLRWSQSSGWTDTGWTDRTVEWVNEDASRLVSGTSVWTEGLGWRSFEELLRFAGVNLGGWRIDALEAMGSNGTTFAGHAIDPDGNDRSFIVVGLEQVPVPEPSSYGIAAASVLAWLLIRRQRSRRQT